ncbi:DUF2158 domain-containing protein [Janthinobacterium sp.]|uniref:YodC family protein n=1 Tax=Janthinobacterium sp. TaxID=1871054 RepID=UPI002639BD78|nr:DUF2158 domain-containing protein [Janthinobacterium sp.]
MASFKKGDVVKLKSGGPHMTVESLDDYSDGAGIGIKDGVYCIWFDGAKKVGEVFDAATLDASF